MESVEETPTQAQETPAQAAVESPPSQTITTVTKKRIKDPVKQQAGRLGAAIKTHNLKQKLLHDLQGRKDREVEVQHEVPVKVVESPAESNTDWTILAIGAAAGAIALNQKLLLPSK